LFHVWRKQRERDFAFGFVFTETKPEGTRTKPKKHQKNIQCLLWGLTGGVLFVCFLGNKFYDDSQRLLPLIISFINSYHRQSYDSVSSLCLSHFNFSLIMPATSNFIVRTFG